MIGGVVLLGALTYRVFEGGRIGDGVWWAFVTGTTVGYGDISPRGGWERLIAVLIMLSAILFTQLLTAHVTNRLVRDDNVFTHEEQEEIKSLMREAIGVLRDVRDNMFTHAEQIEVMEELDQIRASVGRIGAVEEALTRVEARLAGDVTVPVSPGGEKSGA
ncbi:MAG: two pore domain potassium channel family protein [Actinomycetales bacterium]|nr:two pore domain potassium channel family protein [Actinomycetales bacterium]